MSRANECLLAAHAAGYRITADGVVISPRGRLLTPVIRGGYKRFKRHPSDVPIGFHRLQAFQKFGDAVFKPLIYVRHLNGNPLDNSVENIAIGTPHENQMDRHPEDRRAHAMKATDASRRYDHAAILAFLRDGHTQAQARIAFGVASKGSMSFIARKSLASA